MATNNFKPFATAANANVTAQADWESLPALLSGFTAGKASSAQVNKAIRQASFIAAALAQYTANKSGLDVLDDGDLNGFIAKMSAAFGKDFQALDATLTALAGLTTGANKLPYFTGTDTASQTDLTSVGRDIIGKGTIADILTYLGLGGGAKLAAAIGAGAGNGYISIPCLIDGVEKKIVIQWGWSAAKPSATASDGNTIVFPIAFDTACAAVVAVYDNGGGSIPTPATGGYTTTSFLLRCSASAGSYNYRWIAVGY
ncbi:gp53-like domain-containing protein [Escherichia coli]|uniref:gp53-like domain-containing protein n=1 Tax=Escherichia coli TaxID=562 RepID=UPI001CFB1E8A|nr:phage tail protein [Escherichia coli]MCB4621241.1 phage tail protein [Escherichia coli]